MHQYLQSTYSPCSNCYGLKTQTFLNKAPRYSVILPWDIIVVKSRHDQTCTSEKMLSPESEGKLFSSWGIIEKNNLRRAPFSTALPCILLIPWMANKMHHFFLWLPWLSLVFTEVYICDCLKSWSYWKSSISLRVSFHGDWSITIPLWSTYFQGSIQTSILLAPLISTAICSVRVF